MKDPHRATRAANLGYLVGGGFMGLMGMVFIFAGSVWRASSAKIRTSRR